MGQVSSEFAGYKTRASRLNQFFKNLVMGSSLTYHDRTFGPLLYFPWIAKESHIT